MIAPHSTHVAMAVFPALMTAFLTNAFAFRHPSHRFTTYNVSATGVARRGRAGLDHGPGGLLHRLKHALG